ncbi:hypothetical protein ACN42_g4996, partial [Penicillium freii]
RGLTLNIFNTRGPRFNPGLGPIGSQKAIGPSPGLNRGPRVLKMFRVNPLNANHTTRPPGQLICCGPEYA